MRGCGECLFTNGEIQLNASKISDNNLVSPCIEKRVWDMRETRESKANIKFNLKISWISSTNTFRFYICCVSVCVCFLPAYDGVHTKWLCGDYFIRRNFARADRRHTNVLYEQIIIIIMCSLLFSSQRTAHRSTCDEENSPNSHVIVYTMDTLNRLHECDEDNHFSSLFCLLLLLLLFLFLSFFAHSVGCVSQNTHFSGIACAMCALDIYAKMNKWLAMWVMPNASHNPNMF